MRKCKETGDSRELEKERLAEQSINRNSRGSDVVGSAEGSPWRERERRRHSEPNVACMCARTWRRVGRVSKKARVCVELSPAFFSPG